MPQSVKDFKNSCDVLTERFAKIQRHANSIANLNLGKRRNHCNHVRWAAGHDAVWLPCCEPGIPCTSRIMIGVESYSVEKCKHLVVACSEVKYCLRHI